MKRVYLCLAFAASTLASLAPATIPADQGIIFGRNRGRVVQQPCVQCVTPNYVYHQPYVPPPPPYVPPPCPPKPVYHEPHHEPYHEPAYPAQKVIAQEIAVAPLIVTVPVESKAVPVHAYGQPQYYSFGEAYREKAYLREVLREELRSLISGGGGVGNPSALTAPRAPITSPSTPSGPNPPATPSTPKSSGGAPTPDTTTDPALQAKVIAGFKGRANCFGCHGGGPKLSGDFALVVEDGRGGHVLAKHDKYVRWTIYGMASSGAMPLAAREDASKAMETTHLPSLLQYAVGKD